MHTPREATACHLLRGDGENTEMLLGKRAPTLFCGGLWCGPGGKMDPGEGILTCLGREVREEIGIKVNTKTAIHFATVDFYHPFRQGHRLEWKVHFFRARHWIGTPEVSEELIKLRWFSIRSLPYEKMMPGHDSWLPMTWNGQCVDRIIKAEIFFADPDLKNLEKGKFKFVPRIS